MESAVEAPPLGQNNNNNNNNINNNNNNDLCSPIAKGKRTKRHRTHSPIPFTIITPTSTIHNNNNTNINPSSSSSSSVEDDSFTTEEEDTAKCLILLAQGHFPPINNIPIKPYLDHHVPAKSAGTVMYTCKTCNRAFTSFQALGGHRASHKKPKNEKKSATLLFNSDEEDYNFPSPRNRVVSSHSHSSLSLQLSSIPNSAFSSVKTPSPRIHECSYCGAEFTSGQALGGHMRRHRTNPPPSPASTMVVHELKSPRTMLSLDLNLPAPAEDENQRFGFAQGKGSTDQNEAASSRLVLSTNTTTTPKLVDCHY